MPPRVVLVTGVSRHLGSRLAGVLALDPSVERIVGVDTVAPRPEQRALLGRTEFVRADIRNPLIAKVIAQAGVDTVVHMNVVATPSGAGGRTAMKEINVIGTMQLLAACQKAPTMRKLVVKSTTAVYGSSPRDPALFTEDQEPRALPRGGYAKDAVEVEGYVRGFGRRRPDVALTVCRFTNFVGPTIDSPLTRYLSLPVVPTVLGFDPRLQLCHEDDGIEVLRRTTLEDHPGTFNVGGEGVLLLSQALRRLGRPSVPVPSVAGRPPRADGADRESPQGENSFPAALTSEVDAGGDAGVGAAGSTVVTSGTTAARGVAANSADAAPATRRLATGRSGFSFSAALGRSLVPRRRREAPSDALPRRTGSRARSVSGTLTVRAGRAGRDAACATGARAGCARAGGGGPSWTSVVATAPPPATAAAEAATAASLPVEAASTAAWSLIADTAARSWMVVATVS